MSEAAEGIVCHSYTLACRHQEVTGNIGGYKTRFQSNNTQLTMLAVVPTALLTTRHFWGQAVPWGGQVLLILGLPWLFWWLARDWWPEDRSPLKYCGGVLAYVLRPRGGRRNGRALRVTSRGNAAYGRFFFSGTP